MDDGEDERNLRERLLDLLRADADDGNSGVSSDVIKEHVAEDEFAHVPTVLNDLMAENRVEVFEMEGQRGTLYKLRDEKDTEKMNELTNEQILVFQVIDASDSSGVWLRDIKAATSMTQQALSKALKVLESRKLVKTVRSVQQKTKKLYMRYDKQPTREVSGGPWYTDQEFDHEFVGALKKYITQMVVRAQQCSLDEIYNAVKKSGVSTVSLSRDDLKVVVDALCADSDLERINLATATEYKKARPGVDFAWISEVPGGECPWPEPPGGDGEGAWPKYLDAWLAQDVDEDSIMDGR